MRKLTILFVVLFAITVHFAQAKPTPIAEGPQPQDGPPTSWPFTAPTAKSLVDTTYILGGPDRWDGTFETPDGQPDWHGWTHYDVISITDNHWHVSTYWADSIEGHGPGNHALYCGDENIPSCHENDPEGGYGNSWFDDAEWTHAVDDPAQPVVVRLTGVMTVDLWDETWDWLELFVKRGDDAEMLDTWTGRIDTTVTIDYSTVVSPGEYTGPDGDEVMLFWRVWSDGAWSDEDCMAPSHGACQIDDLSVYFDDVLITFDDFEPGNPVNWGPAPFIGVGDFANLRNDLGNLDPCKDNHTWQANFVDDGMVVPELDGTPCIDHCYDPGGWIVNNDGGLLADDNTPWFLENIIVSPPIAYLSGNDGAELLFDVYRHEPFTSSDDAGMFYRWHVRSTDSPDPADLELAPWKDRNWLFYGGPDFKRHEEPVTDLLVPDRQWVQIGLRVTELGWHWGINGSNGTPAPYFDNVALKVWDPVGPDIQVKGYNLFGDAFPQAGSLNPTDLTANSCRVDMNGGLFNGGRGDSLVAMVKPLRHGATVPEDPILHWVMECNPLFDTVRTGVPDQDGILRGMTTGTETMHEHGSPLPDHWTFDLQDQGFFFPGDRLRYYIIGSDDLDGDIRTSVWPPDTTGVTDFSRESPFTSMTEIRGLPSVTQPVAGEFTQPSIIFCNDTDDSRLAAVWYDALDDLGYVRGVAYDIVTLDRIDQEIRLDLTMNLGFFDSYQTMIYARGSEFNGTLQEEDVLHITTWLDLGNKQALMAGDGVGRDFSYGAGPALANRLGVNFEATYIYDLNGGMRDLQISPVFGNGVLPEDLYWQVYDGCPTVRISNAISAMANGVASASLDPEGTTGGPYAALVTVDDQLLLNRTAVMPFELDRVDGLTIGSAKNGDSLSPKALLLDYLLFWLGTDGASPVDDVPEHGQVSVHAQPNPFNPQTTIAFELPRAMAVSLDIYDLQGRLIRSLLNEAAHTAGRHQKVWDGRDGGGQATASGVYFFRFSTGDHQRVGKLTLLK